MKEIGLKQTTVNNTIEVIDSLLGVLAAANIGEQYRGKAIDVKIELLRATHQHDYADLLQQRRDKTKRETQS